MVALIADRFLVRTSAPSVEPAVGLDFSRARQITAMDLATGARIRLRIDAAGTRAEQHAWTDTCAREHTEGALIDFGFIGTTQRFEARSHAGEKRPLVSRATPATMVEWLEHARPSSPRVLYLDEMPDARVIRQHGFVPCDAALLRADDVEPDVCAVLARRSVMVLDPRGLPSGAALAVLRLRQLGVREFGVLAQRASTQKVHVMNAAEGRAAYGGKSDVGEVDRLLERGRHAAAERALRAAAAAFERRGDFRRAGHARLKLARLMLARGRASDACALLTGAHDRFQRARASEDAVEATAYLGLAQTDLQQLSDAELAGRAAYTAASALAEPAALLLPALSLARTLLWQKRHADARSILEAVVPAGDVEQCARYWCLAARL